MQEASEKHTAFRKLHVSLPPIRQENSHFWWLAGIALAVCFLALTLHFYMRYKKEQQQLFYKAQSNSYPLKLYKVKAPYSGALLFNWFQL